MAILESKIMEILTDLEEIEMEELVRILGRKGYSEEEIDDAVVYLLMNSIIVYDALREKITLV